jgi:hypothetical protein
LGKEENSMARKLLRTCVLIATIFILSFPAHADDVETAAFRTLDNTLWYVKNDIMYGIHYIGFSEDRIYTCQIVDECLSCIPVGINYIDLFMVSFFHVVIGDKMALDIRGILFPSVARGFIISEFEGCIFTRMVWSGWTPDVSLCPIGPMFGDVFP